MDNQFYTHCRRCGRQILMTRNRQTGAWVPCDPEILRFTPAGGPETYVNTDGKYCRGKRDRNGEFGYRRHRRDCA